MISKTTRRRRPSFTPRRRSARPRSTAPAPARVRTCAQALKHIDAMLVQLSAEEAEKLWDVLTALRGPDDGSSYLKRITTAPIRTRALPRAMQLLLVDSGGAFHADELTNGRHARHFINHIGAAAYALGMLHDGE